MKRLKFADLTDHDVLDLIGKNGIVYIDDPAEGSWRVAGTVEALQINRNASGEVENVAVKFVGTSALSDEVLINAEILTH